MDLEAQVTVFTYPLRTLCLHYIRCCLETNDLTEVGEIAIGLPRAVAEAVAPFFSDLERGPTVSIKPFKALSAWFMAWDGTIENLQVVEELMNAVCNDALREVMKRDMASLVLFCRMVVRVLPQSHQARFRSKCATYFRDLSQENQEELFKVLCDSPMFEVTAGRKRRRLS